MNTAAVTPNTPARKPGIFINRNYGFLWLGQSISLMGDEIFDFTLLVWFAAFLTRRADGSSESWAPLAVSGILVATAAPYFLVGPLAGVFVDRWDKRRTMLLMDLLRALLIASLLLVAGAFPLPFFVGGKPPLSLQLGMTYAVVFLASSCSQFFNPSRLALIGDIVAEPLRPRATSLAHGSQSVALIVGPLLAAPLLVAFGVQWALTIDALSFVASFLAVLAVQAPAAARSVAPGQKGHFRQEFIGGLRFTFASRVLSTIVIAFAFAGLGFGAVHSLYVFFTQENLHSTVVSVGLVGAVFGGGGVFGAILWAIYAQRIGVIRLFVSSLAGFGLALLLVAQMTSLGPGLALFALTGIAQAGLQVSVGPIVLSATPRAMVGRVFAMLDPVVRLTELLASVLGGYLASSVLLGFHATILGHTFGRLDTIFSVSALIMLSGGVYAMLRLRGMKASQPVAAPVSAEGTSAGEQAEVAAGD